MKFTELLKGNGFNPKSFSLAELKEIKRAYKSKNKKYISMVSHKYGFPCDCEWCGAAFHSQVEITAEREVINQNY